MRWIARTRLRALHLVSQRDAPAADGAVPIKNPVRPRRKSGLRLPAAIQQTTSVGTGRLSFPRT